MNLGHDAIDLTVNIHKSTPSVSLFPAQALEYTAKPVQRSTNETTNLRRKPEEIRSHFLSNLAMLALLKKRVRKKFAFPPTMEVMQLSPSLQDPNQSPREVPEVSIHKEQPLANPRTELLDMERILPHLREIRVEQNCLISETTELRIVIQEMNQWLKAAESRLSSLEAKHYESQQTVSQTQRRVSWYGVPYSIHSWDSAYHIYFKYFKANIVGFVFCFDSVRVFRSK